MMVEPRVIRGNTHSKNFFRKTNESEANQFLNTNASSYRTTNRNINLKS